MKMNLLVKNKSSFNKIGLIVCINAARAVVGHIGSFKSALLELCIMSLQIEILTASGDEGAKPNTCLQSSPAIPIDLG